MLGIGAAMLGSPYVCCVDVDEDALALAQENAAQFEGVEECIDFVRMDIRQLAARIAAGYALKGVYIWYTYGIHAIVTFDGTLHHI